MVDYCTYVFPVRNKQLQHPLTLSQLLYFVSISALIRGFGVVLYNNRVQVCGIIAIFLPTGSSYYEQNLTIVLALMVRIHKCLDPGLRFSCNEIGLLVLHLFICDVHLYLYAYEYNYTPSPHSLIDECIFTTNVGRYCAGE